MEETGKIHFWELNRNTIIKLKDEFWNRINEALSIHNISMRKIHRYLYKFLKDRTISMFNLVRIIDKLKVLSNYFSLENIEEASLIQSIKSGKGGTCIVSPLFPIDLFKAEFLELIGLILSEGTITEKNQVAIFNNKDEILQKAFHDFEHTIGKLDSKIIRKKHDKYGSHRHYIYLPRILGHILVNFLGCCKGNKIVGKIRIPKIYMKISKNPSQSPILNNLLRGLFSGDGHVNCNIKNYDRKILLTANGILPSKTLSKILQNPKRYKRYAPRILKDVKNLMENMGYNVTDPIFKGKNTVRKYKYKSRIIHTASWQIKISNREDIARFREDVGFIDKENQRKLDKLFFSYKKRQFKLHKWKQHCLDCIKELSNNKEIIKSNIIANKMNLSPITINSYLRKLRQENLVRIVSRDKDKRVIYDMVGEQQ